MVEQAGNKLKISIWWDIENCHVPRDVDPHFIAQNLSFALHHANLTGPIEIQVFGDTSILHDKTQKALSDTGITLNHVPRGNKDAADKAILVAMLLWALDNPPPANILLISGDGDFANALNRLRWKTYSILLACPAQFVKPALTGAAKKIWCWKDLAKGQLAEPDLAQRSGDPSQEPSVSNGLMDKFQQKLGSGGLKNSVMHNSAVPNGHVSLQGKGTRSEGNHIVEHFKTLNLENHHRSCSSTLASDERRDESHGTENSYNISSNRRTAEVANNNRRDESHGTENSYNVSSDRRRTAQVANDTFSATSKPNFNASQSRMNAVGTPPPAAHSMDLGKYPYFLPGEADMREIQEPFTSGGLCSNTDVPWSPLAQQFPSIPAGMMPRGPLKHIAPDNRPANNMPPLKHISSDYRAAHNVPPQNRPEPLMPSSYATSNLEGVSHDSCLDKVYSAMKTLERDMLAPTEGNLYDCIRYWDPQHEKVDVKQTLIKAADLRQVTKTQLGRGLVMYIPPDHKVPWSCVDPGNMQDNYSNDIWLELQQFLLNGERKEVFLASCSQYDAAQILKNSGSMHFKNLVVGRIINLLNQAMQWRKWLRKNGLGWAPLFVNQKALLDYSQGKIQKGDMTVNAETMWDKDAILNKLRSWLPQIIKDSSGYDLSLLSRDFELVTGMHLDHQKLGFASLQELMRELSDVVYVQLTQTGLVLLHLIKQDGNVVSNDVVEKGVSKQENQVKALREIQVVRDLKSWLSYLMTVVQDGYDITKIRQDFLQATGKDLEKEGLHFNRLQGILKQFPDVIQIVKTPAGTWVACPARHKIGGARKTAGSMVVPTH